MKTNKILKHLLLTLLIQPLFLNAQEIVDILPGEYWWGGQIDSIGQMPYNDSYQTDLNDLNENQVQPLLLSNKGRYIWHEEPFSFSFNEYQIKLLGSAEEFVIGQSGKSLAEAYSYAVKHFFPYKKSVPAPFMFERPQYNIRIGQLYNKNQEDIVAYANNLIEKGFEPGTIVLGNHWQRDHGDWNFRSDRFPNAKEMINDLHDLGFKVMVWVSPFVSPDCENFKYLDEEEDLFIKDLLNPDDIKIVKWANGYSALLDFSNANTKTWFKAKLDNLIKNYGVDGFKFSGVDAIAYQDVISSNIITPIEQIALYADLARTYKYNEFTSSWKTGGLPLVQSLTTTDPNWRDLERLIPKITLQGIMGYAYSSGGIINQNPLNKDSIDQELLVRLYQIHAFLPVMKFSRITHLDDEHEQACVKASKLHTEFGDYIVGLSGKTANTGKPIVQSMDFAYPNEGQEFNTDQFMLGKNVLVAPILKKGQRSREVWLPEGIWITTGGKGFQGPTTITVNTAIDEIPYFKRGITQKLSK